MKNHRGIFHIIIIAEILFQVVLTLQCLLDNLQGLAGI